MANIIENPKDKDKDKDSGQSTGVIEQSRRSIPIDYLDNGLFKGEAMVKAHQHQEEVIWKRTNAL